MKNQEIALIFYEIADFLEMEKAQFRPQAYRKAAFILEDLKEDIETICRKGGLKALKNIPGVGENMAAKIKEYFETGKIKYYEDLKKKTPVKIKELTAVEGIGPQKVKKLYRELKIKNLVDLEKAAKSHKIAGLFGFDKKTEKNILEGIAFLKKSKGRFLLGEILPRVKEIINRLGKMKEVEQISPAGSVRRMKETVGDVDILVTVKGSVLAGQAANKIMDFFVRLPGITKIWMKGPTKSSVRMEEGNDELRSSSLNPSGLVFDVDLRVVRKKSYGSALQYFTGSKEHNIALRRIAMERKLKLSEYGLFKGPKMIAGWSEQGIYKKLGLNWIPPEIRENQGEIEASMNKKLPQIIGHKDIRGDLHLHSNWNGGADSIEEIAAIAQEMGYQYIGIADHTKFLRIERGLDERKLALQRKEIDKLNSKFEILNPKQILDSKFKILSGCEANILKDGSIDIKDESLAKLDYVIAGVHSGLKMPREQMTERIIKAMKNPHIDIISHPTGRILKKRDEYQIDFDKILRAAKEYGVILEINSYPKRLDLNDRNIRRAKEAGVKMVINTDAHHKDQLRFMELGIAQARRGWAEKKDIINAQPLEKLLKFFHQK